MSTAILVVYLSAFAAGIIHTLLGPDHYVPFIALARARNWTVRKSLLVTLVCGAAHVASAVLLGVLAVSFAGLLPRIGILEDLRGQAASWALTAFGFAYAVWGLRKAFHRAVSPAELLGSGSASGADFASGANPPLRQGKKNSESIVPSLLFIIFALGPCEPLIPVYVAAASGGSVQEALAAVLIFGSATLAAMTAVVGISLGLFANFRFPAFLARFSHLIAGSLVGSCGLAMAVFGL